MSARARAAAAALALIAPAVFTRALSAQDIEAVARMRGLALPAGYFQRMRENPNAFTLPNGLFRVEGGQRVAARTEGTARIVVLPALFSDSQDPFITREMVQEALFDGPTPYGTITEAYAEISRGALTVTGDVLPWVRTSLPMSTVVGESNGLGNDARTGQYLIDALTLADPDVDFGLYDNDGVDGVPNSGDDDGYVDAMTFEFLEIAGSCGGPSIWPHRWGISGWNDKKPYETDDLRPDGTHVKVDGYIVQSVTDCTGRNVQAANVISHEFGHVLGLPDYYHPTASGGAAGRRWVLGCWSLMAAGSWGCGPVVDRTEPFGPTHMVARSKHVLGWLDFFLVGEVRNYEVVLDPVQTSGRALEIPLDESGRESLQISYRAQIGFDRQLPADGVLIFHKDLDGRLRPQPGSGTPYFLSLLEQDDNDGLQRNSFEGGNRGEAGDAWGVGGVPDRLNALTSPAARAHSGRPLPVTLHSIVVENGQARIVLSTAKTPELVAPDSSWTVTRATPFERRLRIAGGTMIYTPSGTVPEDVALAADQDQLVVSGWVADLGPIDMTLRVVDARGNTSPDLTVHMTAEEYALDIDRLVAPLLSSDAQGLTELEITFLDRVGNRNGRFDVGDARRWILSHPEGGAGGR